MPNPLEATANYQGDDGAWYTDDGQYLGGGSQSENGTHANNTENNLVKSLVQDSSYDTIQKWAEKNGYKMSDETKDYLYNQFFTEKNNESAWQRTLQADNTKYQRMVEDMRAAGLNPFVTGFGDASNAGSSSAGSVGSGSITAYKNQSKQTSASYLSSFLSAMASIGGAIIMAMALA